MARLFNQIETQLFIGKKGFIEGNENGILVEWKYKSSVEKKTSYAREVHERQHLPSRFV